MPRLWGEIGELVAAVKARALLARGIREKLGGGKFSVRGDLGRREAAVIYKESAERTLVITVMCTDEE